MSNFLSSQTVSELYRNLPDPISNSSPVIDIQHYRYISNAALVELCSLIEFCLPVYKKIRVILPTIANRIDENIRKLIKVLNYDRDNLSIELRKLGIFYSEEKLIENIKIFNFLCYLHNKKFTSLWNDPYTDGKVVLSNFPYHYADEVFLRYKDKATQIHEEDINHRNTNIHRISGTPYDKKGLLLSLMADLEARLPNEHKSSPLFKDGEFQTIFLNELSDNIARHSWTRGYFFARSLSKNDLQKRKASSYLFLDLPIEFQQKVTSKGFFEVCISDSGPGIAETLGEGYKTILSKLLKINTDKVELKKASIVLQLWSVEARIMPQFL